MMQRSLAAVAIIGMACPSYAEDRPDRTPTIGSGDPKSLEATAEEAAESERLVRLLGGPSYRERESAMRGLAKIGRLAMTAMIAARATESSPEVQWRLDRVLPADQ